MADTLGEIIDRHWDKRPEANGLKVNVHAERLSDGSYVYNVALVDLWRGNVQARIELPAMSEEDAFTLAGKIQCAAVEHTTMGAVDVADYTGFAK